MTATPKETKDVSNIAYFGEPVYIYSLKQGIDDGFLAPYKVIRISMDIDEGYRPEYGKVDKYGVPIEDRIYNTKDFDRNIVIDDRTKKTARKISEYLRKIYRFSKTIVFCIDTEHAERMRRALVNENADIVSHHPNYVVRITGDDEVGQREIDNFIDVEERDLPNVAYDLFTKISLVFKAPDITTTLNVKLLLITETGVSIINKTLHVEK
jgi:type I restriction enzyme R subunit